MKVSVFIPYYNDVKFLGQAIEAVLAQTFRDFELILLNHASTDGSRDLARKYTDARIRHIDVPVNYGAGAGVNLKSFLNVATGDFVKLLCADDILRSNGLELLVDAAERHPGIDAVFGDCAFSDADGVPGEETIFGRATRLLGTDDFYSGQYDNAKLLPLLVRGWTPWPYPGAFVRRTLLQDLSFDVSMIMYFDISLWIDLIIHGAHVAFVKQPILNYRVHTGQTSSQSQKQRIATAVGFEAEKLAARIAACGQPDLIKRAFADSPYAAKCETARDAYFVANEWLLRNLKSRASYCALSSLLDDDAARARLADRFGFTVRTLRGLYMEWDEATRPHATGFKAWKKKVKAATGESLGVAGLSWLLADRIWKNITFKNRN